MSSDEEDVTKFGEMEDGPDESEFYQSTTSGETYDTDEWDGGRDLVESLIPWEWLATRKAIAGMFVLTPMDDAARDKALPVPKKKQDAQTGEWEYVEYAPVWTDPDWEREFDVQHNTEMIRKRPKEEVFRTLRPAITPADSLKNPTEYAKRFGIHPDRHDGRSRASPTLSKARRVPLEMAHGEAGYLTGEDLARVQSGFLAQVPQDDGKLHDFGDNIKSHVRRAPDEPYLASLKALHEIMEEDKNYQRWLFAEYTTDELIEQQAHSLTEVIPDADLNEPLHELIERGRWDNTLNRGCEPGDPKLVYNLGGRRGEWSADDSEIWRAIQPSLRLVSKILNTNHPAWLASLNPYHLRPVPSHLDPRTEEDRALSEIPTLVSIWKELDESKMYPDAKILMQNGFDILKASAAVLKDRIIWSFASSFREDGKILRDQQWSGLTHHPNEEGQIKIFVSCELIWPLLVPDYTLSEKASCAYLLAVSMLHELSHAAQIAPGFLLIPYLRRFIPAIIRDVSLDDLLSLRRLGTHVRSDNFEEYYFEDEPRAEGGFALENQLFGSTIETVLSYDVLHLNRNPVALVMDHWPYASRYPHKMRGNSDGWLYHPPPPVDCTTIAMPIAMFSQFFQEAFWETSYRRYGIQAMKIWPRKTLKVAIRERPRSYSRKKDLKRLFGTEIVEWMSIALTKLKSAGQNVLATYLFDLTWEEVEFDMFRKRWHSEKKRWPFLQESIASCMDDIRNQFELYDEAVSKLRLSPEVQSQEYEQESAYYTTRVMSGEIPYRGELTFEDWTRERGQLCVTALQSLLAHMEELHRQLSHNCNYMQRLIYDYLEQPTAYRVEPHRHYFRPLARLFEKCCEAAASNTIKALEDNILADSLAFNAILGPLEPDVRSVMEKLQMDLNVFRETRKYTTKEWVSAVVEPGKLKTFETVLSARKAKASMRREALAAREFNKLEHGALKDVVERWYDILQMKNSLRHDARGIEAVRLNSMQLSMKDQMKSIEEKLKERGMSLKHKSDEATRPKPKPLSELVQQAHPSAAQFGAPLTQPETSIVPAGYSVHHDSTTGFANYVKDTSGFPLHQGPSMIGAHGPRAPLGKSVPLGAGIPIAPFLDPYATRETMSTDLEGQPKGHGRIPGMFGEVIAPPPGQHEPHPIKPQQQNQNYSFMGFRDNAREDEDD